MLTALSTALPVGTAIIPAHPVAGTEHSGPDAGFAALFRQRWCIITPPESADPAQVEALSAFWSALGARCITLRDPVERAIGVLSKPGHELSAAAQALFDSLHEQQAEARR